MCDGEWVPVRECDNRNRRLVVGYKCTCCLDIIKKNHLHYCRKCHTTIKAPKRYCNECHTLSRRELSRRQRAIHSDNITYIDRMPMHGNMNQLLDIMVKTYTQKDMKA